MISVSPSSLSYKDENGDLPMPSALYDPKSVPNIPLCAKEGVKYKVGAEDGHGGLLLVDNKAGDSTLLLFVLLVCHDPDNPESICVDELFVNVMKELRESNLFTKDETTLRTMKMSLYGLQVVISIPLQLVS